GNPARIALQWFQIGDRVEVGGNVLDCVLAYQLMASAPRLLETEGRPVPENVDPASGAQVTRLNRTPALNRQRLAVCRRMKERFAHASRQYLNWPMGVKPPTGESVPFPNQSHLQGVYLEHSLVDENLFRHILGPAVIQLGQQIMNDMEERLSKDPDAAVARPEEVKRVFYVGGTCIDAFVRERFGQAFPNARGDTDAEAQSPERIAERLNAVVEGAVWYDEQLFTPSPLTLTFRSADREETLLQTGELLLPASLAHPRFITLTLEGHQELDARLFASGGGLPEPVCVARGFYRNPVDSFQEVTLRLQVSREQGATAALLAYDREWELWRFILAEQADQKQ
ncbi:MAG: hypothetical protein RMJ43_03185, partial [Chloroherpetonaceae bacterium]|nr:hypothetical protein [Chloroherpetonaceae bacterium]